MKKPSFVKNRNFRYGTVATAITVGFIALVVVLNIVATLLLQKFPLTVDLTSSGKFEISQQSIDYVQKVDRDVKVFVLSDEKNFSDPANQYTYQVGELLRKYSQHSGRVTVQYIDVVNNPGFAAQYPNETLNEGDIIVQSDLRLQKFGWQDLFNVTTDSTGQYLSSVSSKAEQTITSALLYVTDSNPAKVAFVSGHDEASMASLQDLFKKNGYDTTDVNTFGADIDPETQILVIAGPQRDFTELEIDKIDAFLTNGGKYGKQVYYMANPKQPAMPNLETFLAEWGIKFMDGSAYETDKNKTYYSPLFSIQNPDTLDNTFIGRGDKDKLTTPVLMPNLRPMETLYSTQYNFTLNVLTKTYESAALYPTNAPEDWSTANAAKQAYTSIVATQKATDTPDETAVERSTVVAFGSTDMFAADFMSSTFGNAQFTVDLTNKLVGKQNGITLVAKDLTAATLDINATQAIVLGVVFVAVLPLAVLIIGLVVFLRRRHL